MRIRIKRFTGSDYIDSVGRLACSKGMKAYLVGGAIRDIFAGGQSGMDLDFAISGDGKDLPQIFSTQKGGSFFWLDAERRQSRVVIDHPLRFTIDFAPIRGDSIEEDLQCRDFTINALAVDASTREAMLIDPLQGIKDINTRLLRQCSDSSFQQDPLRLMRLFRFAAVLGFQIEVNTWRRVLENSSCLSLVAPERIRDEFFRILDAPGKRAIIPKMVEAGILQQVLGVEYQGFSWDEAISQVVKLENVIFELKRDLGDLGFILHGYLETEVQQGVKIHSLVRLASLLPNADIAGYSSRLKLSNFTSRMLQRILSVLQNPHIGNDWNDRKMFRFFKDGRIGPEGVVLAAMSGKIRRENALSLIKFYFSIFPRCKELLTGTELMEEFSLQEGKDVGSAIKLISKAETSGLVSTRDEALAYLRIKLLTNAKR